MSEIPNSAKQVIKEFSNLQLGGKFVPCPYFMNMRKQRAGLRVLVGKGDPGEIVREVVVWAKLKNFDLNNKSILEIRHFMIEQNIGIDCSGFITHILNYWLHEQGEKNLIHYLEFPKNNLFARLKRFLRPVENIGANLLTSDLNCDKVSNLNEIRPGDLIRLKGLRKNSHHVMLVTKTVYEDNTIKEFSYIQSTRDYGINNGIREAKVIIINPEGDLKSQNWTEVDQENNRNWTYESLLKKYEDNGIRRLKRVRLAFSE